MLQAERDRIVEFARITASHLRNQAALIREMARALDALDTPALVECARRCASRADELCQAHLEIANDWAEDTQVGPRCQLPADPE